MPDAYTIQYLNETVWCKLAPSPIHGIGVFAIRDIPKGTKLGCKEWYSEECDIHGVKSFEGLHPAILELINQRWPLALKVQYFISPNHDAHLVSFMNHSSEPNWNKYTDEALRDIKAGEEIFEDYSPEIEPPD